MKKFWVIGLLLIPFHVKAALRTSAQNGNWGTASTWVGGTIPGNGDTVSIFHIVTTTDTRTVGTSLGYGSVVVNLNSTGTLVTAPGSTLNIRGDITYTAGVSNLLDAVISSGTLNFDSSASTAPSTIRYAFYPSTNSGFRAFKVIGSSATHASFSGGDMRMNGQAFGNSFIASFANLINVSWEIYTVHDSPTPVVWNVTNSSFNACGIIHDIDSLYPTGSFIHNNNIHFNTTAASIFKFNMDTKLKSPGVRTIQNNVFDKTFDGNGGYADFTMSGNYFGDIFAGNFSTFTYTNNFMRMSQPGAILSGIVTTSYFLLDQDASNPHVINGLALNLPQLYDGLIFGMSGRDAGDDGEFLIFDETTTSSRTVTHSIFMPNGNGYGAVDITSMLGNAKYTDDFEHNTFFGGSSLGSSFAAMDYSETGNAPPGAISAFKSTIVWNPELPGKGASFTKLVDIGNQSSNQGTGYGVGPTTDVCSPSNCDYNASFGALMSTITVPNAAAYHNQGRGYAGNFSSTPGVHDIIGDPAFVDYHRNAEEFDLKYYRPYLGLATPTIWYSTNTYSVGTVVSHSTGNIYWGDLIDYRYTNGSGCSSANPEPGAGLLTSWESCWEFASFKDIRDAIQNSLTFTDATLGTSGADINTTLILWIRAGYTPTNSSYRGAGFAGADIGAVPYASAISNRSPSAPLPPGFTFFPSNNVWNTDITAAPVSSSSTLWVNIINGHAGHNFHANFGSAALGDGSYNGIPYNLVWSTATPRIQVPLGTYATESDTPPVGGIPIPTDAIAENDIEGSSRTVTGDQHLLIIDVSSGVTYEMFVASRVANSTNWTAAQLTIWPNSNALRIDGWTSADAAGLPVTQGLLRYDEVSPVCNITHAIRMELSLTHGPHIWPARHDADSGGALNPPFGMRVRMKASVDLSGMSAVSRCIFNAAKKYGFILADNGGDWYIDGVPNPGWDDESLHDDFIDVGLPIDTMEVIDESTWIVDPDSAQAQAPSPAPIKGIKGRCSFRGGFSFR